MTTTYPHRTRSATAAPRTNRFADSCADCGNMVPAETGTLAKENGVWKVRHIGACPAAVAAPPVRTNLYAATCAACGQDVPAETGALAKENGVWKVRHVGTCPPRPAAPVEPPVEAGYYALGTVAEPIRYRVTHYQTRQYLAVMSKFGSWERITDAADRAAVLTEIAKNPRRSGELYSTVTGRCWACDTELTDPISVYNKIGPVCAPKRGIIRVKPPLSTALVPTWVYAQSRPFGAIPQPSMVATAQFVLPTGQDDWDAVERAMNDMVREGEVAEDRTVAEAKAARDTYLNG